MAIHQGIARICATKICYGLFCVRTTIFGDTLPAAVCRQLTGVLCARHNLSYDIMMRLGYSYLSRVPLLCWPSPSCCVSLRANANECSKISLQSKVPLAYDNRTVSPLLPFRKKRHRGIGAKPGWFVSPDCKGARVFHAGAIQRKACPSSMEHDANDFC